MKKFFGLLTLCFGLLAAQPSYATLHIEINQGNIQPLPIAITDFNSTSGANVAVSDNLAQVITSDLESSGLFRSINKQAFIQKTVAGNAIPQFADWRQINTAGLVTGNISDQGNGQIEVEFRLWDVYTEQQIAGKSYVASNQNWRRIAHMVADEIYKRLTGEEGYFDTRVVYVAESGNGRNRVKRLAIMDQDGANHKFLTDGRNLVLTPRFSPSSQQILYLSYAGKTPRVYLRDIETGREQVMGEFRGMSFAPRFSPDGSKVVMSVADNGNSEIYAMDLRSHRVTRLTNHPAIDTSPSYSPDGRRIVFNSDRGGSQQLYTMDNNGGNVQRISFGNGKYGSPIWSPRGDLIAFTKISRGQFYIGVMKPDGSGERLLTQSYLDESPTWAPNGRVIMFTRQQRGSSYSQGKSQLYSIDLTGYNERPIMTPLDASDPAWSPLLK